MSSNTTNNDNSDSPGTYSRDEQQQTSQQEPEQQIGGSLGGGGGGAIPSRFDAVQQRFSQTKQRLTQSVQELDLQQRVAESKKQISDRVQKLELDQKLSVSKDKLQSMKLEQHLDKAKKGISGAKTRIAETLQKINLARLIDKMEQDQEVADALERRNRDIRDEQEAREMMRVAGAACTEAIESHLESFLAMNPNATYEEWISDLHPENLHEGKLLEGMGKELDHRFYVAESDHRLLWNKSLGEIRKEVPPRSQMWHQHLQQEPSIDFLDQSFTPLESSHASQDSPPAGRSDFLGVADGLIEGQHDDSTLRSEHEDGTSNFLDLTSNEALVGASEATQGCHGNTLLVDIGAPTSAESLLDFLVPENSVQVNETPREELLWFQQP